MNKERIRDSVPKTFASIAILYQRFLGRDAGRAIADGTTNAEPIFKRDHTIWAKSAAANKNWDPYRASIRYNMRTTDIGNSGLIAVVVIV
jgi:hypothetical protein